MAPAAPPATGTLAPASPPSPPAAPTLAPAPAVGPPLALEAPAPTAQRPAPFYQKLWFWGAVGVVVVSAVLITIASSGSSGPDTPATTLGDMHAF